MVMIIVTKDVRADELSEAQSILLSHQPETETGGLCRGCYEFAGSFAWWPCPQVRWAQRVVVAHDGGELRIRGCVSAGSTPSTGTTR